ncbi:adenine phosphoribosyltransferase [Rhodococcus aerolatus]
MSPDPVSPDRAGAAARLVRGLTRTVDDFPAPGVRFADLSPVFADGPAFAAVVAALHGPDDVDLVAGVDARGFLLAAAVALWRGLGVLPVRKAGKLPPPVRSRSYDLEYGSATLEVPAEGVDLAGRRVLVLDDVLATGGTLRAAADLLTAAGAHVVGLGVVLEVPGLGGREAVAGFPLACVVGPHD